MKKVLIIDDEPFICHHIANVLRVKYNIDTEIIKTYNNLEKRLEKGYDAVVLDIMMPFDKTFFGDMELSDSYPELCTGILLFKKIRHIYPKMPIIYHTAMRRVECDERSMILTKPVLASVAAQTINDFIERCEGL